MIDLNITCNCVGSHIISCRVKLIFFLEFQKLFIYVLYQLQNISFVCSVYQTVLLAFQRYLAISKPMEYYASQSAAGMTSKWIFDPFLTQENLTYLSTIFAGGGTDWIITLKYTMPNLIFSILFNLPKFFEFDTQEIMELNSENNVTLTKIKLLPTKLRLNDNYVFYYVNLSRLLVSGLIPLVSLTILNFFIYRY